MTTQHLHFYSYAECLHIKNSKTKRLYNYLRAFVEPEMPDLMREFDALQPLPQSEQERVLGEETYTWTMYSGLFCLYEGNDLLSVIVLEMMTRVDRIITMPKHRRQGHALRLLTELTKQMIGHGCPILISPVYPRIAPLFEKAGWVKVGGGTATTVDYCPAEMKHKYDGADGVISEKWDFRNWGLYLFFLQVHHFKKDLPSGAMERAKVAALNLASTQTPSPC
jgi:GNAT superfamily N-acetyltransferase